MNLKEKPAKAVKQALAAKVGTTSFKREFLVEDDSHEIEGLPGGLRILATWFSLVLNKDREWFQLGIP